MFSGTVTNGSGLLPGLSAQARARRYAGLRDCGEEWFAILTCQLDMECEDLFGDCYVPGGDYDECARLASEREYCEAVCPMFDLEECVQDPAPCRAKGYCDFNGPSQDLDECMEQYTATGVCTYQAATTSCRSYCREQDLNTCVDQVLATGECEFDDGFGACAVLCPDFQPRAYCASYWGDNGMCPSEPPMCIEPPASTCVNGDVDPIQQTCTLTAPPNQQDACDGTESVTNPAACTPTDSTTTYRLTFIQVARDCNVGYDLDGCNGHSCSEGGLAPAEGIGAVDNALTGLAQILANVGGNLRGVDQALHDALCSSDIALTLEVDANAAEGCASVEIADGGTPVGTVLMNLSDAGCLSGALGTLPIHIGAPRSLHHATVRMTMSPTGLSDGVLGAVLDFETAGAVMDAVIDGGSAVVTQLLDINEELVNDSQTPCDAMSASFTIGGVAE